MVNEVCIDPLANNYVPQADPDTSLYVPVLLHKLSLTTNRVPTIMVVQMRMLLIMTVKLQ